MESTRGLEAKVVIMNLSYAAAVSELLYQVTAPALHHVSPFALKRREAGGGRAAVLLPQREYRGE